MLKFETHWLGHELSNSWFPSSFVGDGLVTLGKPLSPKDLGLLIYLWCGDLTIGSKHHMGGKLGLPSFLTWPRNLECSSDKGSGLMLSQSDKATISLLVHRFKNVGLFGRLRDSLQRGGQKILEKAERIGDRIKDIFRG